MVPPATSLMFPKTESSHVSNTLRHAALYWPTARFPGSWPIPLHAKIHSAPMRKLRSYFGACLVCVSAAVLLFPAWTTVPKAATGPTGVFTTLSDTTYVSCENAPAFYSQWYDQIDSVLRVRGDSILNVTPARKTAYAFAGTCSDTVSHAFLVRRSAAPDTTLHYLLIVRDTVPPTIQSALPDSLFLRCGETIPDTAGSILISDNCALDTAIFNQVILGGGLPQHLQNCAHLGRLGPLWATYDLSTGHLHTR